MPELNPHRHIIIYATSAAVLVAAVYHDATSVYHREGRAGWRQLSSWRMPDGCLPYAYRGAEGEAMQVGVAECAGAGRGSEASDLYWSGSWSELGVEMGAVPMVLEVGEELLPQVVSHLLWGLGGLEAANLVLGECLGACRGARGGTTGGNSRV